MSIIKFDRDAMAKWYAKQHREIDSGIISIHWLKSAPEREIWLIEVNNLLAEGNDESVEPIDFGVDRDMETEHKLFVLDVTPNQWTRISNGSLQLPYGWSLKLSDSVSL